MSTRRPEKSFNDHAPRRRRVPLIWGAGLALGLPIAALVPSHIGTTARAATTVIACAAYSGSATFSPGINRTSKTISLTGSGTVTGCTGSRPSIVKGDVTWTNVQVTDASCSISLAGFRGSGTVNDQVIAISWKNASNAEVGTSTITESGSVTASARAFAVTGGGTVTGGTLFNNATTTGVPVLPVPTGVTPMPAALWACNTPGGVTGGRSAGPAVLALVLA
jgi:hypothetical protein